MIDVQTILCVRVYAHTQTVTDIRKVKHLCVCVCVCACTLLLSTFVCVYVRVYTVKDIREVKHLRVCARAYFFFYQTFVCVCVLSSYIDLRQSTTGSRVDSVQVCLCICASMSLCV